jgi:hypothetical protein
LKEGSVKGVEASRRQSEAYRQAALSDGIGRHYTCATMTALVALWLPILLSAVFVFVVSSVMHMALPWHRGDYKKLPDEDATLDGLRATGVLRGQYMFPCAGSMKEMGSPEMQAKLKRGPIGVLIVRGPEAASMGRALGQWFVFCICTAYVTGLHLPGGAGFDTVFRTAGAVATLCHAFTSVNDSIWKGLSWATTFKFVVDGVLYGLATGATFAWCWPAAA